MLDLSFCASVLGSLSYNKSTHDLWSLVKLRISFRNAGGAGLEGASPLGCFYTKRKKMLFTSSQGTWHSSCGHNELFAEVHPVHRKSPGPSQTGFPAIAKTSVEPSVLII